MTTKSKRAFFRITAYVAVILTLTILMLLSGFIPNDRAKQIVQSVILLGYCWVFISMFYHLFQKTSWVIVIFLLLFIFSLYFLVEESPHSFIKNINRSFSLFWARAYIKDAPGWLPYAYFVSHLVFAAFAFSLFGRRLMNRNGYFLIPYNCKNIFWGNSEGGMLLAKNMLDDDSFQQTIFVLSSSISNKGKEDKQVFDRIDRMGAIALYWDSGNAKLPGGHRHFFLSDNQDFNIRMALQLVRHLKGRVSSQKTHLFVRTEVEQIDRYFADELDGTGTIEIHLFNQPDLTARCFVRDHPMLDSPGIELDSDTLLVNGEFNMLLLGFGRTGQELLKKCICDAQFTGSSFKAAIIDKDFDTKYGDYPVLYNECIDAYNLEFIPGSRVDPGVKQAGSVAFYAWIEKKVSSFNRIVIALGDDRVNIDLAVSIAKILQDNGIGDTRRIVFAHVARTEQFAYYKNPKVSSVTLFGDITSIYTQGVLIHEEMDRIAKMVNYVYSCYRQKNIETIDWTEAEILWSHTPLFNKNSSRAVAMNIPNINRIINGKWDGLTTRQLEILAEDEHLRWVAFHLVNGIRKWHLGEIPAGYLNDAKWKDDKGNLMKHACLVDYADMQPVSDKVNKNRRLNQNSEIEDFQETDRRIVRHFPLFLSNSGES